MRFVLVLISILLSSGLSSRGFDKATAGVAVPSQGAFMIKTLKAYSDAYWARVAGRDTGLPARTNGHDEFAARWTNDMLSSLHGLHAGVFRQSFPTPGFKGLVARRPGVNVVVAVPGSEHPARAVIIGAHYDGEPFSKGSAYDDASGCIITLALARTLGAIWRSHGPPSLTVEFVLFDGEEEGLVGSLYFTTAMAQGAVMPAPVLMLNEEQSGVGYPVRPFGLTSEDPIPQIASTAERLPGSFGTPKPIAPADVKRLTARLNAARSNAFSQLHAFYSPISYRGGQREVFTDADQQLLDTGPSNECCSDNDPFQLHGIANVTFSGNFDFYQQNARPWSYPFDQPWDTFTALACDTGGSPKPNAALEAALDLPMTMSALLVQRYAPAGPARGLVALSTTAQRGHPVQFTAMGAASVRWEFGDSASSTELSPSHTYTRAGTYHVRVTGSGISRSWTLRVANHALEFHPTFGVIKPPPIRPWQPEQLHGISGCQ